MQPTKKEERSERILFEAARLFAEKGYEQTTVSDIVKRCDMARGTFYLYFENQEQVLTALFTKVMGLLWEEVLRILRDDAVPEEEKMVQMVRSIFGILKDNQELLSVFNCGGGRAFHEFKYRTIRDNLGVSMAEMIRQDEECRPCSAELVSMMITTLIDQMAYYTLVLDKDAHEQEVVIQELVNFISYGLCRVPNVT